MKIYVVGSVGSGKSTFARALSKATGAPCFHLDEVVRVPDEAQPWGNRKRPREEIDRRFQEILALPDFIIEDVGREMFREGLARADAIALLDPPYRVRAWRILKRWGKQRLGLEKCLYKPRAQVIFCMLRWARRFDTGEDGARARLAPYADKTVALRRDRDLNAFLRRSADGRGPIE